MTAPLVVERAGTVEISAPAGGWKTARDLRPYELDDAEQWAGEAILSAATARVGRGVIGRVLQRLERKARLFDARVRMGQRLTAREEVAFRRLRHDLRHLERLEEGLARVVRRFEDQQALRLVKL